MISESEIKRFCYDFTHQQILTLEDAKPAFDLAEAWLSRKMPKKKLEMREGRMENCEKCKNYTARIRVENNSDSDWTDRNVECRYCTLEPKWLHIYEGHYCSKFTSNSV
jgi:hypothetical protein